MQDKLQLAREVRKNKSKVKWQNYTTLRDYAIDCIIYGVSAQSYGPGAENLIKKFCNFKKETDDDSGDARRNDTRIEVKFSLANPKQKINFVQIRPHYNVDYYLFVYYDITTDTLDSLFLPSKDLYKLIPDYGNYAHGSIKALGEITTESVENNEYEYAFRPEIKDDNKIMCELKKINVVNSKEWLWLKKKII